MKLIDLSREVYDQMSVFPLDEDFRLQQNKHLEKDGYNNYCMHGGMHIGTHIDTPMHMKAGQSFLSDIGLERFIGKACVIEVRDQETITWKKEYTSLISGCSMVIIHTGHHRLYGVSEYYDSHPVLSEEFAKELVRRNIQLVGLDFPSPDVDPFPIHQIFFENNMLIIENLCNTELLPRKENFELMAFPLKIRADASPVRVVARMNEDKEGEIKNGK